VSTSAAAHAKGEKSQNQNEESIMSEYRHVFANEKMMSGAEDEKLSSCDPPGGGGSDVNIRTN